MDLETRRHPDNIAKWFSLIDIDAKRLVAFLDAIEQTTDRDDTKRYCSASGALTPELQLLLVDSLNGKCSIESLGMKIVRAFDFIDSFEFSDRAGTMKLKDISIWDMFAEDYRYDIFVTSIEYDFIENHQKEIGNNLMILYNNHRGSSFYIRFFHENDLDNDNDFYTFKHITFHSYSYGGTFCHGLYSAGDFSSIELDTR